MNEELMTTEERNYETITVEQMIVYSEFLERDVIVDAYLPAVPVPAEDVPLLLVNDGQDLRKMDFGNIIDPMVAAGEITPIMVIALHCGTDRMMEYGTVCRADFRGRGAKAGLYNKFIFDELLPYMRQEFGIESWKEKSFAGFSLGGLSAIDIVWNHAHEFSKVGVFSGSLWWRRRGYNDEGYDYERDRIMHLQVQKGTYYPWLNFFFECGEMDEKADRNKNGVIDSIEDTLDLITHLKTLGYKDADINYLQLPEGRHDVETWGKAFPDFLKWGWGRRE